VSTSQVRWTPSSLANRPTSRWGGQPLTLITQARWKAESGYPIRVFFADEPILSLRAAPPPVVGDL